MNQHSVALLIETSSGYSRGLLDGIKAFAKRHGQWLTYLNEQERGALPPKWLMNWKGDGIIARIETDRIGTQLRQLAIPIVDLSAARYLPGIPWPTRKIERLRNSQLIIFLNVHFAISLIVVIPVSHGPTREETTFAT